MCIRDSVSTIQTGSTPSTTQVKITGTSLGADDCIVNNDIYFTSGDASGEGGTITDYNGTSKVVTYTPATTSASSTDGYAIGPKVVISGDGQGANARCIANTTGGINATAIISTADGYKWKFMYQISASDALKFVTPNYIPVLSLIHI